MSAAAPARRGAAGSPEVARVAVRVDRLDVEAGEVARLAALLSPPEREQAARYRFDLHRRRFIVRRGRLREGLAPLADLPPARLTFGENAWGKPELNGWPGHFSLSHSGEAMMLALSDQPVGCDIEAIQPDLDWPPLAGRFFTAEEQAALHALARADAEEGRRAFFRCWARKEAFVKALGRGLSYPLDAFEVSVAPHAALHRGGEGWAIMAADVKADAGADHTGAVVARDDGTPLSLCPLADYPLAV